MKNLISNKLSIQLGLAITLFIFVIEGILLFTSYTAKKKDLYSLNGRIIEKVQSQTGMTIRQAISDDEIKEELNQFTLNVTGLVLIIIVVVVSGTLFLFHQIAGKYILKLAQLEKENSLRNLALFPTENIPNNELGEVILARNASLKQIQMSAARISILGDVAAGISHEINTPLNIIHGNAQLIRMELEGEQIDLQDAKSNLFKIEKTVEKLGRIVKGISALSRDGEDQKVEPVKVNEILQDVKVFGEDKLTKSDVEMRVVLPNDELTIECRSHQIFQAILNMVKNSCDAIAELEERWIELSVEEDSENVFIKVKDSGDGIPKEIRDKIMQPYFTTKEVGKGTGLGLGFAKTIIEQHGGIISIDSTIEKTCFIIQLPKNANCEALIKKVS